MALPINDGNAQATSLKTTLDGADHVPHHRIDGTVTVTAGTGAADLAKAEDAAHASGDAGVMALGVRNDNAAAVRSGADGDYAPLAVDDRGAVFTRRRPTTTASWASVALTAAAAGEIVAASAARAGLIIANTSSDWLYLRCDSGDPSETAWAFALEPLATVEVPAAFAALAWRGYIVAGGTVTATGVS